MKAVLEASKKDEIMRLVSAHYSALGFTVEAKKIWFIDDPVLV